MQQQRWFRFVGANLHTHYYRNLRFSIAFDYSDTYREVATPHQGSVLGSLFINDSGADSGALRERIDHSADIK
jgi:hypothetical protein